MFLGKVGVSVDDDKFGVLGVSMDTNDFGDSWVSVDADEFGVFGPLFFALADGYGVSSPTNIYMHGSILPPIFAFWMFSLHRYIIVFC